MEKDEKKLAQVVSDMDRLAFKGCVLCGGCVLLQKYSIKYEAKLCCVAFMLFEFVLVWNHNSVNSVLTA